MNVKNVKKANSKLKKIADNINEKLVFNKCTYIECSDPLLTVGLQKLK